MPNWKDVLAEIQGIQFQGEQLKQQAIDFVRHKYLAQLHQKTGRNVISYYSGYLSKPGLTHLEINDEDKNGFMMAVHKLDKKLGLDLILHTPGGSIAATQSIVDYLRKMFKDDMRAFVPQIAMSAGTMIACSCKEIWMARHSNLGPIDPHLHGRPAYGVIMEFDRAKKECAKGGGAIPVWQAIIGQYPPTYLSRCQNAIDWSNAFVEQQLREVMFKGDPKAKDKAKKIVRKLTDYSGNKAHDRHIHFDEIKAAKLKVFEIESDPQLQDLVLTVHHNYMHLMMNTPVFKAVENHTGIGMFKRQVMPQTA